MHIRPIRSDADHEDALREIETLWGAEEGTEAGDRLDVLVTLAETYERQRWPIEPLDPVQAIEAAMETNGYTRAQLAALIGQSRATEILGRRRGLDAADDPGDIASVARSCRGAGTGLCADRAVR